MKKYRLVKAEENGFDNSGDIFVWDEKMLSYKNQNSNHYIGKEAVESNKNFEPVTE